MWKYEPNITCLYHKVTFSLSGIIWKDSHEFISGGKDSKLVMHSFRDAVRICEKVNPIAISTNRGDQLALAVNEKLQVSSSQHTGKRLAASRIIYIALL